MNAKRYTPRWDGVPGVVEHDEGDYVRHEDYDALEKQRDQLRAALVGVLGGVDGREELTELRVLVKHTAPNAETRDVSLAAIDALIATLPGDV